MWLFGMYSVCKKVIPDHVECMQRMNTVTKGRVSEKDCVVNDDYEQV
jgi:hypothetical protein